VRHASVNPKHVLVTGATGYVGGRLVPRLLAAGHRVRCLARDPGRLDGRPWRNDVEVVQGDLLDAASIGRAMEGIDAVYYLVHSLAAGTAFEERDLHAARNCAAAARAAGVGRIIYLGGLGNPDAALSPHLESRQRTGQALREGGVPVTEFRAAVIVGSGSLSFEMIRCLAERLPVMICPRWVTTRVQPIAIRNVLDYLVAALDTEESAGRVVEIGGADVLTYQDMIKKYARARGLRRALVRIPFLTPRLSSYWVHLVTPIPTAIAGALIQGLVNEVVVRDNEAARLFPGVKPMDYASALRLALAKLDGNAVETAWTDSLASSAGDHPPVTLVSHEGMIIERRTRSVDAPADMLFRSFVRLGGDRGWLAYDWAWHLRGGMDRLLGGVGMRRGRRDPNDLRPGDSLDFWRVEQVLPGRMLRLRAEMKVPGRAWLQFEARPTGEGSSELVQTAYFAPKGLFGLLYWYVLYPMHALIFSGLARKVCEAAARER
jgi:uncharacterized protein YbjT (DUF2867 family)